MIGPDLSRTMRKRDGEESASVMITPPPPPPPPQPALTVISDAGLNEKQEATTNN